MPFQQPIATTSHVEHTGQHRPALTALSHQTRLFGVVILFSLVIAGIWTTTAAPQAKAASAPTGLHVSGNTILDGANQPLRLLGVDRSGTEYACIQGWGIFDGPNDAASVQAIANWHTNAVRVPLNEDCWLGINGASSSTSGATYRQAISNYVSLLNQNGLAAVLDLHWNAPGGSQSTGQMQMADADHAPAFWSSVASTFKGNSSVVFDLYNEPHDISWSCWRDGGSCSGVSYQVAGMQSLLNAVRGTGATNVVLAGGLGYAGDLSQWLAYEPSDPQHNLGASWHVYNFSGCNTSSCWDSTVAPVAQKVPVVVGEIGENDCAHGFVDSLMSWLDAHGVSYIGWAWNPFDCGSFPSLITSYDGTPSGFGVGLKDHLAALAAGTPGGTGGGTGGTTCKPTISFASNSASPASVAQGSTVTFSSTFTASCATSGLVDFEAYNSAGTKVWQTYYDNQNLTGQAQTYTANWTVPASQATGGYRLAVGIFAPGWSSNYAWNGNAATFNVAAPVQTCSANPTIAFGAGSASPTTVAPGSAVKLSITFTASCATNGLVDLEVYNSAGTKVWQAYYDNQQLTGHAQTYTATWNIPVGQAAGTYTLDAGVFAPGWTSNYGWDSGATTFSVS